MKKRFEALDAFRGIAAIAVVLFHLRIAGSITEFNFIRGSHLLVEFFFVLSGFVLAHGYGDKTKLYFLTFIKARFFRIYPLHLFMFIVIVLLEFGKLFVHEYYTFNFNDSPFSGRNSISEIVPNLFLIQAWIPFANHLSFNSASWSISIEFYLYILLFMSVVVYTPSKRYIWILSSLVALCLLIYQNEVLEKEVLLGLSCFFGGASTYIIYKKIAHVRLTHMLGSLLEVIVIIVVIMIVQSEFEQRTVIAIIVFFVMVLIYSFESGVISNILKLRPFQFAGKLSYSIYMTHGAIIFCFTSLVMIIQKIFGLNLAPMVNGTRYMTLGCEFINNMFVFLILITVCYTSHITYKYVELNGIKLGKNS
ncbi:acyltransferase family protein [Colwellia piezophila]|uniref:acyltransferase family protein n=1 Tax=Colwellia piezophila TaxID=211668 RepID=UPI00035F0102|nr:acyltransferase [Colwellia piezophila]